MTNFRYWFAITGQADVAQATYSLCLLKFSGMYLRLPSKQRNANCGVPRPPCVASFDAKKHDALGSLVCATLCRKWAPNPRRKTGGCERMTVSKIRFLDFNGVFNLLWSRLIPSPGTICSH